MWFFIAKKSFTQCTMHSRLRNLLWYVLNVPSPVCRMQIYLCNQYLNSNGFYHCHVPLNVANC